MKIYKVKKENLKWTKMSQINFKWNLPILIDTDYNVLAGNSLKDSLNDEILVIIIDKNELLKEDLLYIESKIIEENLEKRFHYCYTEIRNYLVELRKIEIKNNTLFEVERERRCISEKIYKRPNYEVTYAHGVKQECDIKQLSLFEDDETTETKKVNEEKSYDIDLEIMKELL